MIMEEGIKMPEIKNCMLCGKILKGRVDKKYCDDYCRNSYNNQLKGSSNSLVRNINNALGKNRRILEGHLRDKETTAKAHKEKLMQQGFRFNYFTHTYTTRT